MTISDVKQAILKKIADTASTDLAGEEQKRFTRFAEAFIPIHPNDEQLSWHPSDLFGVFYGLFDFMRNRPTGEAKVAVFNPHIETDRWTSSHSVIYFCQQDTPFLIDSLRMLLNRQKLNIHIFENNVLHIERDENGKFISVNEGSLESIGYVLIDCNTETAFLKTLHSQIINLFNDVHCVVDDYQPMLARLNTCLDSFKQHCSEAHEEIAFLEWLRDGNFTFLGCSDFLLEQDNSKIGETDSRLGLLQKRKMLPVAPLAGLCDAFSEFYNSSQLIAFTKSSMASTVHRDVHCDYIIVKRFDDSGKAIGETRFLGLYTAYLYHHSIIGIPLVREKAQWLLISSGLNDASHHSKTMLAIMEDFPRDEFIQTPKEQLLKTLLGIWKIYERRSTKLFVRVDTFEKFVSCIVYLPRESINSTTRQYIEQLLSKQFNAISCETNTQFIAASVLGRIHCILRINDRQFETVKVQQLEQDIVNLSRNWQDRLNELCIERLGEEQGNKAIQLLAGAYPASYQERYAPPSAISDYQMFQQLNDDDDINLTLFHEVGSANNNIRLKIIHPKSSLALTDIIPLLENLGSRVLTEHPFRITLANETVLWLHDFTLQLSLPTGRSLDIAAVSDMFKDAFRAIWQGKAENDRFNQLIFSARLDWQTVALLRAYARYLRQLGSAFSSGYIASVLNNNIDVCRSIVALFRYQLDPRRQEKNVERANQVRQSIAAALESVTNLNEDQVLRQFVAMIDATIRSNFFQTEADGSSKPCIAIKINTQQLDFAPEPKPEFEVYVYSPRVEGVHLRGGPVARGGLRWSDRLQDFRTEVLGLVKAQQVKNAVIVPTGAKGGFVARNTAHISDRDAFIAEGIACYQLFVGSLLDIADNREGNTVISPKQVVKRDQDDPYFVVAADKGTATFSDIANKISLERNFWLGDAFASGGSNGYDHKAMGITAKGAWVAVQRHFRELGLNTQTDNFSVIGIGDMAGDVFGNGMLLSKHIQLVAAFNHLHIFIDPTPDPTASWQERQRLFDLPRSSWSDYDQTLISEGGGIFNRSAKSIALSPQLQSLTQSNKPSLTPTELIHQLLKAKVDLIWNGGIGTYVKASSESHLEVGDRANDALRVNGEDLNCRVFGEGGNLGLTQRGRMEYSQQGGICNTDFIDNAAGVDCSDHEVNIKILLNAEVQSQDLTAKQRNLLLSKMTDEVSAQVLANNYRQTLAISLARHRKQKHHHDYLRFIETMEEKGRLNRALEFLPEDDVIKDLHANEKSWSRPELSVLISYAKVELKEELSASNVASDAWVSKIALSAFPATLQQTYPEKIEQHQLHREIVATQLANKIVNQMGFTYFMKQRSSVGASAADTAKVFLVVMALFDLDSLWQQIEAQDYTVDSAVQYELMHQIMRLGRRASRWFLRNQRDMDVGNTIESLKPAFDALTPKVYTMQTALQQAFWSQQAQQWLEEGIDQTVADRTAAFDAYFLLPGIISEANTKGLEPEPLLALCFSLADQLSVDWILQRLIQWQPENRWQDLAREAYVDDLEMLLRELTFALYQAHQNNESLIQQWQAHIGERYHRFERFISNMKGSTISDLSVFAVAIRELKDLVVETQSIAAKE